MMCKRATQLQSRWLSALAVRVCYRMQHQVHYLFDLHPPVDTCMRAHLYTSGAQCTEGIYIYSDRKAYTVGVLEQMFREGICLSPPSQTIHLCMR